MELKEVILSTIAEIGDEVAKSVPSDITDSSENEDGENISEKPSAKEPADIDFIEQQREFLEQMRERILVLFEGFQSPNNKNIEAKIDLTLNFMEYLLASLDERIDSLKK